MTTQLTAAITEQLLPAINAVAAEHTGGHCRQCTAASRRECPSLGLAADALDLVIRCRRFTKATREEPASSGTAMTRDLRSAVESKRLSDTEAEALAEILGVLDLAVVQAEESGLCLPMLAGIAVAVVDSYRAVVAAS